MARNQTLENKITKKEIGSLSGMEMNTPSLYGNLRGIRKIAFAQEVLEKRLAKKTLESIGTEIGVTRERVRQIEGWGCAVIEHMRTIHTTN